MLASQSEAISHWAAYFNVHPILLAQLISVLPDEEVGGTQTIKNVASMLSQLAPEASEHHNVTPTSPGELTQQLSSRFALSPGVSRQLIERTMKDSKKAGLMSSGAAASDSPPALDLPFIRPQNWQFNGTHTWTGDDDGTPFSSIDFTRSWGQNWGDSTSADLVSAAHDGLITVFSSCYVQVQHDSGWGTRYYHLDSLQVATGQTVLAGQVLGNYASEENQALCSGGSSTGPHVHFALLKDGQYFSLQDIELSGYQVHPGTSSYDSSRSRMWLEKRATRYYAFGLSIGTQEGDNTIDYRYNGMWYSPANNGHGINVEITEFPGETGNRKAVFIVVYTFDDSGLANFYVGNMDFERWRSDEVMVVDMLQAAGGDFSSLAAIDASDPQQLRPAGTAAIGFSDCSNASIQLNLEERSSGQLVQHEIDLVKVIGVPAHVCEAASLPLSIN